jgi:hypothetical protein
VGTENGLGEEGEGNANIKQIIESIEYYEKELSPNGKYSDVSAGFIYDLFEKYENTQSKKPS